MPTTLSGLLIFVVLIVPGLTHYLQRKARSPRRTLSPLGEAAALVTASAICYAVALALFSLIRVAAADHSPDVRRLLLEGEKYAAPRLGYLASWATALVLIATMMAYLLGARIGPVGRFFRAFTPVIADASAWYHTFETGPGDSYVHVGCDMRDGAYVAGRLEWYSTEVDEKADRDLALAEPITFRPAGDTEDRELHISRIIISGREVSRMLVSYVAVPRAKSL